MKKSKLSATLIVSFWLVVGLIQVGQAAPMGTAFTYQGRLTDANQPADGLYDFQFKLYDRIDGGNQIGSAVNINEVDVIDGYFTVELDFGIDVFGADARWLQVALRPGDSTGDFTALSPMQKMAASPYALSAREVTGRVRTPGIYETLSYTWISRESARNWQAVAISADGRIQTAVVAGGKIYVSMDTGNTWLPRESDRDWHSVAMSADGTIQTATVYTGQIYVSTDSGTTWTPKESDRYWASVAMSDDGNIQTAVVFTGQIYVSTDAGNTWRPKESNRYWQSVSMSADGTIQTAVAYKGQIYVSTDTGNTWVPKESNRYWRSVAISADGRVQTAVVYPGQIYVSTDTGNTWVIRESDRYWASVAMSDDGTIQTAVAYNDQIYISTDTGNSWVPHESNRDWRSVAVSADGKIQTAVVYNGQLYVAAGLTEVGIGTTSPTATLDVRGDVQATGILNKNYDLQIATDPDAEVAIGAEIVSDRKLNVYTDSDIYGLYIENAKTIGIRYGIRSVASGNTTGDSIGLFGAGSSASSNNIGVYGLAVTASSGTNYGIWAEAENSGTGDAYAAYFNGDVIATGRTSIGTSVLNIDKKLNVYTPSDQYGLYCENARSSSGTNNYGVYAKALNCSVINYGLYGEAAGASGHNYGVRGAATGNTTGTSYGIVGSSSSASGSNYAIRGIANTASVGTNIAVYGIASNSGIGNAWAGYFDGRGYFSGDIGIGTTSPSEKLDVAGNIDVSNNRVKNYRGFPRPDYDSGWVSISTNEYRTLTHNLGGDVDNYVVDMQFKYDSGINQICYGYDRYDKVGAFWRDLTTSSIQIYRGYNDISAEQIRIRIWMYD